MSTRAIYTVKEGREAYHVYIHYDGYPTGAADKIRKALSLAWPLPRFEPDEFAAALVAANKNHAGGIRLLKSGTVREISPADIEYRYEITERLGAVQVKAFRTNYWDAPVDTLIFDGSLDGFEKWAAKNEEEAA